MCVGTIASSAFLIVFAHRPVIDARAQHSQRVLKCRNRNFDLICVMEVHSAHRDDDNRQRNLHIRSLRHK